MARFAQLANIPASQYVIPSSRYYRSRVIYYTDRRLITYETYKRKATALQINDQDQWMTITPDMEYRPDKASYAVYSTPDFWWRLMEVNGIKDVMDFKAGRNIRIPGNLLL